MSPICFNLFYDNKKRWPKTVIIKAKTLLVHNILSSSSMQQDGEENGMIVVPIMVQSIVIQPLCMFYFNDLFVRSAENYFHYISSRKNSAYINSSSWTNQSLSCSLITSSLPESNCINDPTTMSVSPNTYLLNVNSLEVTATTIL